MDSSEREPSYYEVALTHRQVLAGFVILLACLFAAFFSGIWIGQGGAPRSESHVAAVDSNTAAQDAKLDQLTFFGDRSKNGASGARVVGGPPAAKPEATPPPAAAPAPAAEPTPAESEAEKLRATLEAEMSSHRDGAPAAATTTAGAPAPAVGARVQRVPSGAATSPAVTPTPAKATATPAKATAAPAAASSPAPSSGNFWVQVYSTATRNKADEVVARLKKGGYPTRLLSPTATSKNFRVRVGPYPARDKATVVADKLRKDLRLETWVTDRL